MLTDWLAVAAGLMAHVLIVLIGYGVARAAGRRPGRLAALLLGVLALGAVGITVAKVEGCAFNPQTYRVEFGSTAARVGFGGGCLLVMLAAPALVVLVGVRAQMEARKGRLTAGDWVGVLFGYWMGCFITAIATYSLVTGHVK